MPNPKVYCVDCEYYEDRNGKDICHFRQGKKDTPIKRVAKKSRPRDMNKNNKCSHYKEKT